MMNTARRVWRQISPRIYGLALIMKIGIPLAFILSMAIGGYLAFSSISNQVKEFQEEVNEQIVSIEKSAEDLTKEFEDVMDALEPVVNAVNKIGSAVNKIGNVINKAGKLIPNLNLNLKLNFLSLPAIPELESAYLAAKEGVEAPLKNMSAYVAEAYEVAKKVAAVASAAFVLWVMALMVVFGAHWYREFVHGWKLILHGAVAAPTNGSTDVQNQIDALKAELSSRNMSRPSGASQGSLWLVLLAFLLLLLYAWNAQNRLFELLKNRPVVPSQPTVETKPPPPDPVVQTTLVELDGKLVFNAGSAAMNARGREVVQQLVPDLLVKLSQEPDKLLMVGGHTDDVPIKHSHFRSNRALSFARASAVAQLLIDEGVPAQRVVAIGFGASRPRIPNEDAVSRHLNRRVELVLAPMAALDDQVLQLPGA